MPINDVIPVEIHTIYYASMYVNTVCVDLQDFDLGNQNHDFDVCFSNEHWILRCPPKELEFFFMWQ